MFKLPLTSILIWLLSLKVTGSCAENDLSKLTRSATVPEAEGKEDEGASPWYIFNDFVVRNISEQEALSFPGRWKVGLSAVRVIINLTPSLDSCSLTF